MNAPFLNAGVKPKTFNVDAVRADFPILARQVHGKALVYLDSAASAQKPQSVIDAISRTYGHEYANVHRGAYYLSEMATRAYEDAREKVRAFLNAPRKEEIIDDRSGRRRRRPYRRIGGRPTRPQDDGETTAWLRPVGRLESRT